jgi:histidyl-tRNA synthetase
MRAEGRVVAAQRPDVFLVSVGDEARRKAFATAERLRGAVPGIHVSMGQPSSGVKAQLRRADKSGARYALIIGEDELASDKVSIKALREELAQQLMTAEELTGYLQRRLAAAESR